MQQNQSKKRSILYFMLLPVVITAQSITQQEFLNRLKTIHPCIEKEKLTARIHQAEQNHTLGAQDWQVVTSAQIAHEEPVIAVAGPENMDAVAFSGGLSKVFWNTGGRFSTAFTTMRANVKIDPLWGLPDAFYQNQLSVSYVHPLLKNSKGFLDRLEYTLRQYDIDISELQAEENVEMFLLKSMFKYLEWGFLTEQQTIVRERLELSREELDRTKRKRRANLVDQADVIRAEDAVRIWKQNEMGVESRRLALRAELAVLLQLDSPDQLHPDFDLYTVYPQPVLEEAKARLLETSRILSVFDIRDAQLDWVGKGYEETGKRDLSLYADVNIKRLNESALKSLGMNKPDATIGLSYAFPVENRSAIALMEKTHLQKIQLAKFREEIVIEMTSALANLHTQIEKVQQVLLLNQEQITSSKERTREELKLYNQGRGDLTFVILSRDNEQNAKLTYAVNALKYHHMRMQYQALTDNLYTSFREKKGE